MQSVCKSRCCAIWYYEEGCLTRRSVAPDMCFPVPFQTREGSSVAVIFASLTEHPLIALALI